MQRLLLSAILLIVLSNLLFAGRYYDAATGRFLQIDPKVDKFPSWSGYVYVKNNPLNRIDLDGKEDILVKQVRNSSETSAESIYLVYPTGTFDDQSLESLRTMSVSEIESTFGLASMKTIGSSLPDDAATSHTEMGGNATILEGKYEYSKGTFSSGLEVIYLSEGKGEGNISTVYENPNNNGKKIATGVAAHAAKNEWQKEIAKGNYSTDKKKGSSACPVAIGFSYILKNIDENGNFIIVRDENEQ